MIAPLLTGAAFAFIGHRLSAEEGVVGEEPKNVEQMMHKFATEEVTKDNVSDYYSKIDPTVYNEFLQHIDF